ncbi:uncharacterized protein LOC133908349 [Phragmites australis]|uniref:uncharacterized protein LOC133908349 n=1 Tax=Phragmites australis TaxID=29695 RepID=UPI002D76E682|nr:uncharacterized protein LOC133908349 [Phragmites australis]
MRRRVVRVHRPSRAARRRLSRLKGSPCRHAGAAHYLGCCAYKEGANGKGTRKMSTAAGFAIRSSASAIVGSLGTPATSSSSSSASARPRLIRNAPVFAAPTTVVVF